MSNNNELSAQCWDRSSPVELHLLIEKEQASIQLLTASWDKLLKSLYIHQTINEDKIFSQSTATKQDLYSAEQCIQELDHTLQQAEQKDSQYLSKQLNSLKLQTSNISYLVEAVDILLKCTDESVFEHYETTITNTIAHADNQLDTLTPIMNKIADRLKRTKLNQVVIAQRQQHTKSDKVKEGEESLFFDSPAHIADTPYHAANVSFTERLLFFPSARPTSPDSSSFEFKILTGLSAYNLERDGDLEPFLQQLENNLQIVNLNPNLWNMALAKHTQGSKTASSWVQNNIVIPRLPWHQARDIYATHFSSTELETHLHDDFFKLTY
ncbi:hypothetical protein QOT17_009284 [Balamuthia mandrillaris]